MNDQQPIVMVELDGYSTDDGAHAHRRFEELGLPATRTLAKEFEDGSWRYYAVMATPKPTEDCVALVRDAEVVAFVHGADCNMVRAIAADIRRGTQSPFEYCSRREAGGSFRAVDAPHTTTKENGA